MNSTNNQTAPDNLTDLTDLTDYTDKSLESQKVKVKPLGYERSSDKDQLISEFLGVDLTEDELKQLALGEIRIDYSPEHGPRKIFIESPDVAQNFRHRLVAYLIGRGFTKDEICKVTGYSRPALNQVLRMPWVKQAAEKFQDKIIKEIQTDKSLALKRLAELSHQAVDTLEDHLTSEDEHIQHKSAVKILEAIEVLGSKQQKTQNVDIGVQIATLIRGD